MTKRKRKSTQSERGQSLVELAITLPILILLLLGTLDFGMAIFSYSMLRDAAQEGAFYGSFNPSNVAEIENRARNISPRADDEVFSSPVQLRDTDLIKVNVKALGNSCQGAKDGAANSIQVNVSYRYPILMPFIGRLIGSSTIPLTGTATNVILQPQCP
ncbi:MAG: TadE/TadG family type IV pilus assembly protein [Anaerolineales bacterium]|nr:TadE/TadG family type IV pilus assembly protein [Anaerolineales bacterium]